MDEKDAVALDNLFPGFGKVSTRRGSISYATGMTGTVFTLAEFNAGLFRKMIAAADGKIWDVSAAGTGTSLKTGFTSDKWQWAQFDSANNGARMGLVNGQDPPQQYDGSGVTAMTISGSGLTAANLIGINIYKNRSYFWDNRSQNFWYSSVNALGGTLTKFPLGRVQGTGGNLQFMATWTRDSGSGMDDLAVFALTSGDVLVYQGSNPGDAADWALLGVFAMGSPLSIRGYAKVAGDLWIITRSGYLPLSKVLSDGQAKEADFALSAKIRGAVSEALNSYSATYGWQAILYPRHSLGTCCIFNAPLSGAEFQQHVVNVATGAWCRWTGLQARCWAVYNDSLYFGGAGGIVYKADSGTSDASRAINFVGQPAWNYLQKRGQQKELTLCRLLGGADGEISYTVDIATDFNVMRPEITGKTPSQGAGGFWDTSDWDATDWPAESRAFDNWHSAGGVGFNFGLRLRFSTGTSGLDWSSFALAYKRGSVL
jgi:hypothetical protein